MAGTSVLKLKVDDKEYNSSLKQAQQGLQHLGQALNNAGKSFTQVDKSVVDYVRSIGQMEAQSKTARGRIGEMSSAFVELSRMEKQLTDQERQSPVGQALAESLEQLKQRTIEAKQELADLNTQLETQKMPEVSVGGGMFSGDKLSGMLQVFGGNLMTKAAESAMSFATEIGNCITQGIELARQGEGIRNAFERLGRGDILQGLREATHGTVTDLELMKAAVKFNDFKLPVEELGTMLAFAQQKAKDTGQSVDYMVDSIVTGLGRKSLMILDNLGLSANEVNEKMKETGDMTKAVGAIIREQMSKAGDYVETAADRATKADVELKNAMEDLGRTLQPLSDTGVSVFNSLKLSALSLLNDAIKPLIQAFTKLGAVQKIQENMNGGGMMGRFANNLRNSNNKESLYSRQMMEINRAINRAQGNLSEAEKGGKGSIEIYRNRLQALINIKNEYERVAKAIMESETAIATGDTPSSATVKTGGGRSKAQKIPEYGDFQKQLTKSLLKKDALRPEDTLGPSDLWKEYADGIRDSLGSIGDSFSNLTEWTDNFDPYLENMEKMKEAAQQERMAMNLASQAVGSFSQALASMDDPAAKAAGTVLQAIASIALGFATASAQAGALGPFGWIAWLAAGAAAMATTISTVHSLTGYADGGIVQGNSFSGDNVYAGNAWVNSGELILNKAQQNSVASQLEGNGIGNLNLRGVLSGENIVIVADRFLQRSGKGELAVWKK